MLRRVFAGSLLVFVCGCASSGTGVPDLEARALAKPRFLAVQPRELTLSVDDVRVASGDAGAEHELAEGLRFRLPTSADLLARLQPDCAIPPGPTAPPQGLFLISVEYPN